VYPSQFAGTNQAKGVEFERFDLPYAKTDEPGVAEIGPYRGSG
jgi:hypothetical protein